MAAKNAFMGRLLGSSNKYNNRQVAETLSMLVKYGLERKASDIHIEPHDRFVLVRYRIGGTLRGMHKFPRETLTMVITQAKKLAGLSPQETLLPQEGFYEASIDGREITIRVSTMPVYGGEKAVLHLTIHPGKPKPLKDLGFWGQGLKTIQLVLTSPHGLVLVAGPRHSGVSSTLFGLLNQLNSPMVSIATVEMSAKHRLPGVNQTYAAANSMTIREGLQAALRQDANIIMVSNLPDSSTAELAVQAATTGHLVLVGMHAESAAAAALRMRVSGVEPFMLATGLRASISQRLVRQLCPKCRERYSITANELQMIKQTFGVTTATAMKRVCDLERSASADGLGIPGQFNTTTNQITHLWRPSANGCTECDHTGYHDRISISEIMPGTEEVQKGLMNPNVASVAALQKIAVKDGFVPLALDGLIKALRGYTTINDVLHAINVSPPDLTAVG